MTDPDTGNTGDPGQGGDGAGNDAGGGNNGNGGDGNADFISTLGEKHAGNDFFKDVESAEALADRTVELNTELQDLKGKIPEVPEQYSAPEVPEGVEFQEEIFNDFAQGARDRGMSDEMVKYAAEFQLGMEKKLLEQVETEREAFREAMKTEWGPEYDKNLELANEGVKKLAAAAKIEVTDLLGTKDPAGQKTFLADNPQFAKAFLIVSKMMSSDSLPGDPGPGGEGDGVARDDAGQPMLEFSDMDK